MNFEKFRLGLKILFGSMLVGSAGAVLNLGFLINDNLDSTFAILPGPAELHLALGAGIEVLFYLGFVVGRIFCAIGAGRPNRRWFIRSLLADAGVAVLLVFGLAGMTSLPSVAMGAIAAMCLVQFAGILCLIHGLGQAAKSVELESLFLNARRQFDFLIFSTVLSGLLVAAALTFYRLNESEPAERALRIVVTLAGVCCFVNWLRFICLLENSVRKFPSKAPATDLGQLAGSPETE